MSEPTRYTDEELKEIIRYYTWRDPLKRRKARLQPAGTWEDVSQHRPDFPSWVRLRRKAGWWVAYWAGHSSEVGPDMVGGKGYTLYFDGSTVYQGYESAEAAMDAGFALLVLVGEKEKEKKKA